MRNVQNAKAEVSQFQNLNSESATVSVIFTVARSAHLYLNSETFSKLK